MNLKECKQIQDVLNKYYEYPENKFKELEKQILAEGCRDAIVIWDGKIVDGHHRYEICQKHDIEFGTTEMEFDSMDDAILWAVDNNNNRRGDGTTFASIALDYEVRIDILRKQAEERIQEHGGTAPGKSKTPSNNVYQVSGRVDEFIAQRANCSHVTASRAISILDRGEKVFGKEVYANIFGRLISRSEEIEKRQSIYGVWQNLKSLENVAKKVKEGKVSQEAVNTIVKPKVKEEFTEAVTDTPENISYDIQEEIANELDEDDDKYTIGAKIQEKLKGKKSVAVQTESEEIPFEKYLKSTRDKLSEGAVQLAFIVDTMRSYEKDNGEVFPLSEHDNVGFSLSVQSMVEALSMLLDYGKDKQENPNTKLITEGE